MEAEVPVGKRRSLAEGSRRREGLEMEEEEEIVEERGCGRSGIIRTPEEEMEMEEEEEGAGTFGIGRFLPLLG